MDRYEQDVTITLYKSADCTGPPVSLPLAPQKNACTLLTSAPSFPNQYSLTYDGQIYSLVRNPELVRVGNCAFWFFSDSNCRRQLNSTVPSAPSTTPDWLFSAPPPGQCMQNLTFEGAPQIDNLYVEVGCNAP